MLTKANPPAQTAQAVEAAVVRRYRAIRAVATHGVLISLALQVGAIPPREVRRPLERTLYESENECVRVVRRAHLL